MIMKGFKMEKLDLATQGKVAGSAGQGGCGTLHLAESLFVTGSYLVPALPS